MGFNFNYILFPLALVLLLVCFGSGIYIIFRSFFGFRAQIKRSVNMDLEIIKVSKIYRKDEERTAEKDAWKGEIGSMEQLFVTLANIKNNLGIFQRIFYGQPHISLEIANPAGEEEVFFYMSVPKKFRERIEKQVLSFFPNASMEKIPDYTIFHPGNFTAAATLKLKNKYLLPIRTYRNMEVDPLNEISNSFSKLNEEKEGASIQLVMVPAGFGWREEGRTVAHEMQQGKRLNEVFSRSISHKIGKGIGKGLSEVIQATASKDGIGRSQDEKTVQLTPEEQELVKSIEKKSNLVGFKVNLRIISSAKSQERADEILAQIENSFSQFENSDLNYFQIHRRVKGKKIAFDYIFRNFDEEHAIIMSTEEIASIYHFPISTTETPKIKWLKSGAAAPPPNLPKGGILLGYNDYRGVNSEIRLTDDDRRRHLYVIGQTGTGKSNLLKEMAKQDVRNGKGICVIDPHGDFAEDVLTAVPIERAEDVVYFDPSDIERPFGLNMLEYDPTRPEQKTFVINEMINIFDKLYDLKQTGGPMFEQYMRNAMQLIMDDPETGSTLMEISKVLADEDFRRLKLTKCQNPVVRDFWIKEAEKAGGEAALANMVPYITSKLTTFIANDMMRPIVAQQQSSLNFRDIMDSGKILIINLSKGKIGEINSHLLGMVIVGKLLMAALGRVDVPQEERKDFYLYIDEFQNVTTDSISQILSEARKYRLNLVIAHQFIGQLSEEISKAVFGNVGSLTSFRVGPEDAEFLEKQFTPIFTASDLSNVDNYNCFVKLLIKNESTKPFNMKTFSPTHGDQELANNLKHLSRLKYGRDSKIVNREIMERSKLSL